MQFFIVTGLLFWLLVVLSVLAKLWRIQRGKALENIAEKWIVVPGCDSGFGLGVVKKLSEKGARVIACTLTEEGAQKALEAGAKLAPCFNLTDENKLAEAINEVKEISNDCLWGVVHNAGVVNPGFIEYQPLSNYRTVMDVNFFSVVALTQKLIPAIKKGAGRIVLISSVDGIVSLPGNAPYDASKFAIEAYADALRVELSFWQIPVSVVNPSTMRTPLAMNFFGAHQQAWNKMNEQDPEGSWKKAYSSEWLEKYISQNKPRIESIAQDPEHTIKDIAHALTSTRPRIRYLSGSLAKTLFFALWKMPERWSFVVKKATVNPPPNS